MVLRKRAASVDARAEPLRQKGARNAWCGFAQEQLTVEESCSETFMVKVKPCPRSRA